MESTITRLQTALEHLGPYPPSQEHIDSLVKQALEQSGSSSTADSKSRWEFALKNEVYNIAMREGEALQNPQTTYYELLRTVLDLVLTFTEYDACDPSFTFLLLQELFEMQTVASCSHIFSWVEDRAERLTNGVTTQKGRSLPILRCLNDLLRRISKTGSTTPFCGRILTFLSSVFPLGERSGVNLRGEYGRTWEGVTGKAEKLRSISQWSESEEVEAAMQVDDDLSTSKPEAEEKDSFYTTFWSLQLPFSKPSELVGTDAFKKFQAAVDAVIPVIKEATIKERAMTGSKTLSGAVPVSSLKRKRESSDAEDDSSAQDYFFAKFLTNPDLLELEIADTHFRRQFIFQLLILLHHLQSYTPSAKASWANLRNKSLLMDFTLEPADSQWVQETIVKTTKELEQTIPNGRAFAEVAKTILQRDENWVKWKNMQCPPFEKEPWSKVGPDGNKLTLEQATADIRKKMREDPPAWKWAKGSEALTEIWGMGYRDLRNLEAEMRPGKVTDYVKSVEREDAKIRMRQDRLAQQAKLKAAREQAAAKAKLDAAEAAASQAASPAPAEDAVMEDVTTPPGPPAPVAIPASSVAAASPLHPSLPSKPGTVDRAATPAPTAPKRPVSKPPVPAASTLPTDPQIREIEESKQRYAWLGLRLARDQHLSLFGKIGTGDIVQLSKEIERQKADKDKELEKGQSEEQVKAESEDASEVKAEPEDASSPPPAAGASSEDLPETQPAQTAALSNSADAVMADA